jgi:hypothetical protein
MLPWLEAEARERQLATLKQNQNKQDTVVAILPQREQSMSGRSREQAAALVGVGERYIQDAKSIKAADPTLFESVRNGAYSLPEAKTLVALEPEIRQQVEQAVAQTGQSVKKVAQLIVSSETNEWYFPLCGKSRLCKFIETDSLREVHAREISKLSKFDNLAPWLTQAPLDIR